MTACQLSSQLFDAWLVAMTMSAIMDTVSTDALNSTLTAVDAKDERTERPSSNKMLRNAFAIGVVVASVYVLNSRYAHRACNVCTVIPACLFSMAQLFDETTQLFAYKATLIYWAVSGVLVGSDTVFEGCLGYSFGKFVLLTLLFLNAVHQQQLSRRMRCQQGSVPAISTALAFTDESSLDQRMRRLTECESDSLCSSSGAAPEIDVTGFSDVDLYDEEVGNEESSVDVFGAFEESGKLSRGEGESSERMRSTADSTIRTARHSMRRAQAPGSFLDEGTLSVHLAHDTQTANQLAVFKAPFKDTLRVTLKNKFASKIVWALRTNAVERLVAEPTSGVLAAGDVTEFQLGLEQTPPSSAARADRIAIDYCAVEPWTTTFDRSLFQNAQMDHQRMKIDVAYEY